MYIWHIMFHQEKLYILKNIYICRKIVTKDQRPGVPIVGVVLTDGISKDEVKTRNAAKLLKDMGVTMYSIGVTDIKNKDELNDIASAPENVITFQTFSELADKLESLVKLVCPSKHKSMIRTMYS